MAIIYNREHIPCNGEIVAEANVNLYFSALSFKIDYEIKFESGKSITLHGAGADVRVNKEQYMKYAQKFNKMNLIEYQDKENKNRFLIPISKFVDKDL